MHQTFTGTSGFVF